MTPIEGYNRIIYFLVFYKFIFLIFYSLNLYGRLFNRTIYENTTNITLLTEYIFLIAMGIVLFYKFNAGLNEINLEEKILISTLSFVIILDSMLNIWAIQW